MNKIISKVTAVFVVCVLMLGIFSLNAAALSGSTNIVPSNEKPKIGTTLIVTASFNLSEKANATGELKYDSTKLKYLTSSPAGDTNGNTKGIVYFVADDFASSHYFRVEFEVIAEGETSLDLVNCVASVSSDVNIPGHSKTIKIGNVQNNTTQDPNKNKGAALKSISVSSGTLKPEFKADVTEYTVVVPYSHTDGILSCESVDPNAKIAVEGSRQLKVGLNKRVIIVTASNGDQRRYTVTFNRLDENGNDTTATGEEGLKTTVNGKEFIISQADASIVPPTGFSVATAPYGEQEIAVYADASGKIMLCYLIAADESEKGFFLYEDGTFKTFNFIDASGKIYIVIEGQQAPDGFYKSEYIQDERKIPCYKYMAKEYADYIVVFVKATDGQSGYYRYDTSEGTIQRFPEFKDGAKVDVMNQKTEIVDFNTKVIVWALSGLLVMAFIAIIVLLIIKLSLNAKNKKAEKEYFDNDNF